MRVCNEKSGNETGLYTMLSRPARGHVEHDDGRTRWWGSGGMHELGLRNTGLMRGMRFGMAMREMEMVLLGGLIGGCFLVFLPTSKTSLYVPSIMSSATGQASFTGRPSPSTSPLVHQNSS
jgi:hypothetical protein